MDREAMQMALEALELLARYENPSTKIQVRKPKDGGPIVTMYPHKVATEAAELLRERLAQPDQEPVAWMHTTGTGHVYFRKKPQDKVFNPQPVYTAPPKREWVGLTADEIWKCNKASGSAVEYHICYAHQNVLDFAEAIEEKLKEKNT